jgi:SAM-dependent methyltransferase
MERDADMFLARWGKKRYKRPPLLTEWLTFLPPHATLLDLGCGAGQDARELKTLGHRVIGLDRTWPLLSFGKRRGPTVPLVLGELRHLPIRPDRLDGIWAAASLMHLPKLSMKKVLVNLHGLMRPGGLLAATITHGTTSRIRNKGWMPGRFFARWRKDELAKALRRVGWKVLSLRVVSNQERKGRWINVIARQGG